jgi:serine/threonine-protein kinase RsbT
MPSTNGAGQQEYESQEAALLLGGESQELSLSKSLDTVIARATARKLAGLLGYNLVDQARIATAVFEIAHDIVAYAGQGQIVISWREDDASHRGLEFFCNDQGQHATNLTSVLKAGGTDADNKLNFLGLKKLVDEFIVTEDEEYGNCIRFVKWIK